MPVVTDVLWTLRPGSLPALRHWGNETVAHHQASNDTHRLDSRAGWVLEALTPGQPLSIADLLALAPFDADGEGLCQLLSTLERLGFVRQC